MNDSPENHWTATARTLLDLEPSSRTDALGRMEPRVRAAVEAEMRQISKLQR